MHFTQLFKIANYLQVWVCQHNKVCLSATQSSRIYTGWFCYSDVIRHVEIRNPYVCSSWLLNSISVLSAIHVLNMTQLFVSY